MTLLDFGGTTILWRRKVACRRGLLQPSGIGGNAERGIQAPLKSPDNHLIKLVVGLSISLWASTSTSVYFKWLGFSKKVGGSEFKCLEISKSCPLNLDVRISLTKYNYYSIRSIVTFIYVLK